MKKNEGRCPKNREIIIFEVELRLHLQPGLPGIR
jgi:hypothetical protein